MCLTGEGHQHQGIPGVQQRPPAASLPRQQAAHREISRHHQQLESQRARADHRHEREEQLGQRWVDRAGARMVDQISSGRSKKLQLK